MSLHTIKREYVYPLNDMQKKALAYIHSLGYVFQYRLSEKMLYFKTPSEPSFSANLSNNILQEYADRPENYPFDPSMVEIVP